MSKSAPVDTSGSQDGRRETVEAALASLQKTLTKIRGCSEKEKQALRREVEQLESMEQKLTQGRVEIVVFGEISTGKSALINALIGEAVTEVDVRGGWTKEVWHVPWEGSGYCIPGLDQSQIVLIDTPGINEVGGASRAELADEAAERSDLILFVTDSDLNDTEFTALATLAARNKPILLILNKVDLYSQQQRQQLIEILQDRCRDIVSADNIIPASADPREIEYVIEDAHGKTRHELRKPQADVESVKARILEILAQEGLALLALNAAMYTADKSDRIAVLRIQMREQAAQQTIWTFAGLKSVAVALNPVGFADVAGGATVDVAMVITLGRIYGLEMAWQPAKDLFLAIAKAAGWVMLGETVTHFLSSSLKVLTAGAATLLTAVPQAAAAGYGSFIVGQAAKYYFEQGASWGGESPKAVVRRILETTDRDSVIARLKDELKEKLHRNPHSPSNKE